MKMKTDINNMESSKAFYEARYQINYMDSWRRWKKERIKKVRYSPILATKPRVPIV